MTEHSIDELKRQLNNARSKLNTANIAAAAAEKRLHDAKCAKTGLIGMIAVTRSNKFLITGIEFIGEEPFWLKGFKIKKDGKPGFQEVGNSFDGVTLQFLNPNPPKHNPINTEKA